MSEINIDAQLVKQGGLSRAEEKLIEMQNGCICCTLREDLLLEVARLARSGHFDHLLIESTAFQNRFRSRRRSRSRTKRDRVLAIWPNLTPWSRW